MSQQIASGPPSLNKQTTVALGYKQKGWSVIPVQAGGKTPIVEWKDFTTRTASDIEIMDWFNTVRNLNIGIVTGKISNLIVVDLDGREGISEAAQLGLTSPHTVITGKGRHLYYKWIPNIKNAVRIRPGIDIRSDGGFVCAPWSVNPNGKRYTWLKPVCRVEKLQPFPTHLFATSVGVLDQTTTVVKKEESWIAKSLEEMKDGNIDDTLFIVASRMRNDGYTESDCMVLLRPHAERVGATPGHLEEKIRNVWNRYEPKMPGIPLSSISRLVIHSPTNPDSQQQFSDRTVVGERNKEFPTGYTCFDDLTGGLRRTEILTVAARTGVGKTNWLIGPARTLCEANKKVLMFSTEMSFDQIWSRYRATLKNDGDFAQHQFYVCDDFAPNPARIEEALRLIMPDVFIFDHINNVGEEHHQLSEFMKNLKLLARKFNIPCIMAAQLNRGADFVENGAHIPPRLSMIKGSGTIEEVSAQVLLLSETRVTPEGTEIVGVVDKNRWGQKGILNFMLKTNPYRLEEVQQ